ncbi:enoyl-CoA hydratase-related protein [Castellaniella sp. S9]|uniref:enoyl-CoA hydratase-related protein n=1 Tax=Castellaniella sp. S9 TaxID=2993652 RepID=UPI0022B410E7|nr:enoyl-CoA hydratase-related protein [Castellaniella sp. S9]
MSGADVPAGRVVLGREAAVATVLLEHPGRLNAITIAMWRALENAFRGFSADASLRCVVVRGAGGQFAAGADIREFPQARADIEGVTAYHRDVIAPALDAVGACMHPVVAAIEGVCVGGGLEIASRCDLRIAARGACFGAPINRLGFPMAPDEMRGLLDLAGHAATLEILLEGRVFDADEAMAKGLLTRVVDDEAFDEALQGAVARIVAGAPLAARLNKRIAAQLRRAEPASFSDAQWREFFSYAHSGDHRRGIQAFLDGQDPVFTGD